MNTPESQIAPEPLLSRLLCRWVELCQQHARATTVLLLLATLGLGLYASANLGFNSDPNALFSKDLRFQRTQLERCTDRREPQSCIALGIAVAIAITEQFGLDVGSCFVELGL